MLLLIPLSVLIALSPLIARLLAMAVSRQREYLADATAAQYTRNPRGLAEALEKNSRFGNVVSKSKPRYCPSVLRQSSAPANRRSTR
jgi:Zn-dependent protease with chaperone function